MSPGTGKPGRGLRGWPGREGRVTQTGRMFRPATPADAKGLLTEAIRGDDPAARVVMCSAMGQQSMVIESIQAGARDFIVKPFQPDRVLEAIQKALA